MITRYVTFGCGQMLQGYQICIIGENLEDIYRAINRNFGSCWCRLYEKPATEKLLLTVNLDNCDF